MTGAGCVVVGRVAVVVGGAVAREVEGAVVATVVGAAVVDGACVVVDSSVVVVSARGSWSSTAPSGVVCVGSSSPHAPSANRTAPTTKTRFTIVTSPPALRSVRSRPPKPDRRRQQATGTDDPIYPCSTDRRSSHHALKTSASTCFTPPITTCGSSPAAIAS